MNKLTLAILVAFLALALSGCGTSPTASKSLSSSVSLASSSSQAASSGTTALVSSSSVAKPLGKRISLMATGGLAKRSALPRVADAVTPVVLPFGTVGKIVANYFELQDAGDSVITNLMVKSSKGIVAPQRMEFGELALPNQQTMVPILGLAVLTYGENPWGTTAVRTADTGAGTDTLTFYDTGTDSTITANSEVVGKYIVTFYVEYAKPTFTLVQDTLDSTYSLMSTNEGNCPYTATTIGATSAKITGMYDLTDTVHVTVAGGATDTVSHGVAEGMWYGGMAIAFSTYALAGNPYPVTSDCLFAEDLSKVTTVLVTK